MRSSDTVRRTWRQLPWIDKFGYSVIAGFLVAIVALVSCTVLGRDERPVQPPGTTMALHTTGEALWRSTAATEASQGILRR
jgi:hypothetical protein